MEVDLKIHGIFLERMPIDKNIAAQQMMQQKLMQLAAARKLSFSTFQQTFVLEFWFVFIQLLRTSMVFNIMTLFKFRDSGSP